MKPSKHRGQKDLDDHLATGSKEVAVRVLKVWNLATWKMWSVDGCGELTTCCYIECMFSTLAKFVSEHEVEAKR